MNSALVDRIEQLTLHWAGQQFSGDDFRRLLGPGVYVLVKQNEVMYVGMGRCLLNRVSHANSHSSRTIAKDECDKVLLYPCRSIQAAIELETILIEHLQPKQNERLKLNKLKHRLGIVVTSNVTPYKSAQILKQNKVCGRLAQNEGQALTHPSA